MKSVSCWLSLAVVALAGFSVSATTLDAAQFQMQAQFAVKGYSGASTLTDFPVLVRLGKDRPSGFTYAVAGVNGANLRFADAEGNLIPHEVDTWNPSGESLVWVKLPALPAGGTNLWCYSSPVTGATLPEVSSSAVWTKYVAVMHGNEFRDSSPSQLPVANGGAVTAGNDDALLGKSYYKSDYRATGMNFTNPWTAGKFTTNGKMTVSGWMKFEKTQNTHVWFSTVCTYGTAGSISYWARGKDDNGGWIEANTSGSAVSGTRLPILPYNVWNHVAVAYDGTSMGLYCNGACQASATGNALGDTSQPNWTFGSYAGSGSNDSFQGVMDELRIYDGTASADWIKAEYDTAHDENFLEEVVDETLSGSATLAVKGYVGASTLTDFPVLVRLSKDRPSGFTYAAAGANGAGLRFADAEGNLLPYEVDTWNVSGESLVWVKLPTLPANGANFRIRWSSAAKPLPPELAAVNVWTKYVAVMHGNEFRDSSPSQLSVANGGAVTAGNDDALLGKSYYKSDRTQTGMNFTNPWTAGKFTTNGKMTVSGWMKFEKTQNTHVWFSTVYTYGDEGSISYWARGEDDGGWIEANTSGSATSGTRLSTLPYNVWNHVAIAYDNTSMGLYCNGACQASATVNALGDTSQPNWTFGSYAGRGSADSFQGVMDELRIYDGTASADWIRAEYDSAHNANFVEEIVDESLFAHGATLAVPGYEGTSTLEDFPVLVRICENSPQGFAYADAGPGGASLRFADAEGRLLAFEIDTWNESGESLVWVRLPSLARALTMFKMLWGTSDSDGLPMPTPRNTWSKYVAVMHGNEFADASPSQLSVANGGAVTAGNDDALLGKSYYKSDRTQTGMNFTNPWTTGLFAANGKMTVSGWMKFEETQNTHVWFSTVYTYGDKGSISYWARGEDDIGWIEANTSGSSTSGTRLSTLPYNVWNHVAIAYDNTSMGLYCNGACQKSATVNALGDTSQPNWTFGSYAGRGSADSFQGVMDELRIYDGTASADWIKAEYDSAHDAGFVEEVADDTPVTATWKGEGGAGKVDDARNWECRNVAGGVIEGHLPRPDLTTIMIRGGVSGFSVTDAAACCGRRYLVEDAALSGDCDWTGLAGRLEFVGTLDLNGHTLTVADLPGAGTITGAGTLRVVTAGTATIATALTGELALVKAGAGTLIAARAGQSYTGGTTVEAGILRFATANAPAGALTGTIAVKNGGAVDLYGNAGLAYPYEIEGNGPEGRGALFTSLDQYYSWYTTWMGDVVLTGDASFGGNIVCNGHTLTLNKHVLSLNADAAKKINDSEDLFQNVRVTDEGVIRVSVGRLSSLANGSPENVTISGENVTLEITGTGSQDGMIVRGKFEVRNLLYSSAWELRENSAKVFVTGCYRPDSTALPPVVLTGPDAELDLSTQAETFAVSTGEGLSFDDNAVVKLAVGEREFEDGEQLVSWTAPENLVMPQFKLAGAAKGKYYLRTTNEGVLIYRSGLIILMR